MAGISELPDDVLDIILKHLINIDTSFIPPHVEPERREWIQKILIGRFTVARLRLVCRRWADWLHERHLYRMLSIGSSHESDAFIDQLGRRPISKAIPRCRYLKVSELWTYGPLALPASERKQKTEFADLDTLLEKFSETIVTLDIKVVNFFTLPIATIERIGRLTNLRTLRLGIRFTQGTKLRGVAVGSVPRGLPFDTDCLDTLLKTAEGLVYTDFTDFRPVCSPMTLGLSLADHQLSKITTLKLDVKGEGNLVQDGIVSLSTKLPNLKVLSIGGLGHDGQILLPLFQNIRERLEELVVTDVRIINPILNMQFPKLRLFRLHDWDRRSRCFLENVMFSSAPLEVLAFDSFPFHKARNASLDIPMASLQPHLKRLEFHYTSHFAQPRHYERLCQDHKVQCVYIHHENIRMTEDDRLDPSLISDLRSKHAL
ncbi:hypothetical protein PSTG_11729 [Puccinia striiformis f. sp. tritici PST-78]|uniref:Uncharacterized protein n=1 Tax=Puccinia striiformis f. sp. tritici PST-78 TaxID=1165861 RepID=A0A0L0V6N7_9BASI|nr:hypothetical protein PSTG_11729 [Puccinia striiformis f. sp. tritici PST-78]